MSDVMQQTTELASSTPPIEFFDQVEVWDEASEDLDDDSIVAAHKGAAAELLDEHVRSEADQTARDELAAKLLNLITSAAESRFSDASRKFDLVNQLVARFGDLCDHSQLQTVLDKHLPGSDMLKRTKADAEADADDDENAGQPGEKHSWFSRAGAIALKPLFAGFRKLVLFVR